MNSPGVHRACFLLGPSRFGWACLIVVGGFVFDGWLHADFAVQAPVVEPVDVRHRGPFDVVGVLPGSFVVDEFGHGCCGDFGQWSLLK